MNMSESILKLAPALLAAQKSMGNATKDSKNPFFKSSYADLNAVREVAIPALNAQGITILQPTVVVGGKNYVNTLLLHESGEYMGSLTEIKNTKGDAQGEGSGISYSRRYGLQSFLNIGAVDDDGEKSMARITEKVADPKTEVKKSSFNKNKSFTEIAKNIDETINAPLTTEQVTKINSIIGDDW
jgi:hypothetical protein